VKAEPRDPQMAEPRDQDLLPMSPPGTRSLGFEAWAPVTKSCAGVPHCRKSEEVHVASSLALPARS
jgi:hypothetical protein